MMAWQPSFQIDIRQLVDVLGLLGGRDLEINYHLEFELVTVGEMFLHVNYLQRQTLGTDAKKSFITVKMRNGHMSSSLARNNTSRAATLAPLSNNNSPA